MKEIINKVVMIGPPHSGKSTIANYLADATDSSSGEYHATKGVRILEFNSNVGKSYKTVDVQLWDCGGDPQNEMFWPALARDAIALILVAPSNLGESDMQFLEMLYLRFGAQHGLKESQCAIFLNKLQGEQSKVSDLPKMFSKVQTEVVSLSEASSICDAFQRILGNAIKVKQEEFRKGEKEIFKLDE